MARKKKYPKLPNGYGQIRYLGKKRRNPYGIYPPATFNEEGKAEQQKAICYVDTWLKGFAVLTSYKAGTYTPGEERELSIDESNSPDSFVQKLLSDYNKVQGIEIKEDTLTFSDVYDKFWNYKYETESGKKLSVASRHSTQAAYKNCRALHDKNFRSLRLDDLQSVVDACPLKHSSIELVVSLIKQMYNYADVYELCDKNYGTHVKININDDDESGVPFTEDELKTLWKNKDNDTVEFMLIMCYSGFRVSEYKKLEINIEERYFKGGMKTRAGKNRTVPIHSGIFKMVKERNQKYGCLLNISVGEYRSKMYKTLQSLGIEKHTPHDCRHTFSALCEKYKVAENDRKRMLGHSFGNDVTNAVYGHRTVEDLRTEIEKINLL